MSAAASFAVTRMIDSMSLARDSLSRSGGLKQFKHARVHSATTNLRDDVLSLECCSRWGSMEGS